MTPKQQRFVQEYLKDLNGTQAAIRAGYAESGAHVEAARLLKNAKVAAAIAAGQQERAEKVGVTAERVLAELAKIGFSDVRRLFTPGGCLVPVPELDDEAAAAVASVEVVTRKVPGGDSDEVERVAKIKLWDKRAALVDMGKHLGMFTDKLEVNGAMSLTVLPEDAGL